LNPNQLRQHGNHVHDVPRQFDPDSKHVIKNPSKGLTLPLALNGIISYLPTWKPTQGEMKEFWALKPKSWIELTLDVAQKLYDKSFKINEDQLAIDARNTAKVLTEHSLGNKIESLT
jgi:hypothetical protein